MSNNIELAESAERPRATELPVSRSAWLGNLLRDRVLAGQYCPGERIPESELRLEFGLSNGPIRDALQFLVAEGLAEKVPWQGVRVIKLTESEILELFQIRLALLEYAAERAALNAPPEILAQAPQIKEKIDAIFEAAQSEPSHPSSNRQLSRWILAGAGNRKLAQTWDRTVSICHIYMRALLTSANEARSHRLIHSLIDAIVARDVAAARAAVRELTIQTLDDLNIKGL